jgi:hypothetical protein
MSKKPPTIIYKGRTLGIVLLTVAQLIIGVIHAFFGLLLLAYENFSFLPTNVVYDLYTLVFGLLALVFAVFIWQGKKMGWIGTVAISMFVIAADSLAVLDLPSIPGIPKLPAITEIAYSLLIVFYLIQSNIRRKYLASSKDKKLKKIN